METACNAVNDLSVTARCPYCGAPTPITLPEDYAPTYADCVICGKRFIMERLAEGFEVMTIEAAPCSSNPDWREIEMGGSDEQ